VVEAGDSLVVAPFAVGVDGWKARRWLSTKVLSNLAHLGVGTVYWKVSPRRVGNAQAVAGQLAGAGRAGLEVVSKSADMPRLVLSGPPGQTKSNTLSEVITALAENREAPERSGSEMIELLSWVPPAARERPCLARGRPASFVRLKPAADGRIDVEKTRIVSIFIDGLELQGGSQ
jgi:hypothetical protein